MILGILFFILFSFSIFLIWASYPWSISERIESGDIFTFRVEETSGSEMTPSVIKILTYNVSFLYGNGSEGSGYQHRDKGFYNKALQQIASEIKSWDVDIVCLQEVDFSSSRSHYLNQAQFIAQKAGFSFVAEAPSWDSNYIPFPYWPLSNNFGRMKSGGAIISKYPILLQEVTLLPKPSSQPWWYNLFYLHRYLQKVTIQVGDKNFKLINLHLEAFDKIDRRKQIEGLVKKVLAEGIDVVAGDFNMVPKSATKKSKFFNNDDYENDSSYEIMLKSRLFEVIPDEIYAKDEVMFFTYPADKPDRRLDYIWYKSGLKMMKAEVLISTSSDHLPLKASFQIDAPRFNPYSQ
jgi:endonuclease/exonuclease/phosphatase family metal-dependent hydrolase